MSAPVRRGQHEEGGIPAGTQRAGLAVVKRALQASGDPP